MKNLLFVLLCAFTMSVTAQTNFIHNDTYSWMENDSKVLMNTIDKILDKDVSTVNKRTFIKSIRSTTNLLFDAGNNLAITGEDKKTRADRYANFQEFVDVSREDPSLKELELTSETALELRETTSSLRDILQSLHNNQYPIESHNENYRASMDLLKRYKKLYTKAEGILNNNLVN